MKVLSTETNPGHQKSLFEFTHGVDVDFRLAAQEVQVQGAWARALGQIGVLKSSEVDALLHELGSALELMETGKFEWRVEDEDIHMNLERFLTECLGETGKRIHLGRSRNDLIATSLRLFVAECMGAASKLTGELIDAIATRACDFEDVIVPGMTHLQSGQPIRLASAFSSHAWAFLRDLERLQTAGRRAMTVMPLGSAALAGTSLPVDLEKIASDLGFSRAPENSYDSVGDRDFMVEALDALASVGVHLSRFAEDLIIWSSGFAGLLKLPKAWSTGSSIMPNKRNPDVPELVRAKSTHLISAAHQAHLLIKGLPTSYASDLHELKKVFLASFDEAGKCLQILLPFTRELEVDRKRAAELLQTGHILATDIANHLTLSGMPFREAYGEVASLVERANQQGVSVEKIFTGTQIDFETSVEIRKQSGGTALACVRTSLEKLVAAKNQLLEKGAG